MACVTLIILDGVGIGAMPDAASWGDEGSNTLLHVAEATGGLYLPNLQRLGLGNIIDVPGIPPAEHPRAAYGQMAVQSAGKDSTMGHWEIAGLISPRPFPTYPEGFPQEIIEEFELRTERRVIGNKAASGTEIIAELGATQLETGALIVYTSADSVFQIAAHEDVISLESLYAYCKIARELMTGDHVVARVIARPYVGKPGAFERTAARRDFSLEPPHPTLLDELNTAGKPVITIGKVDDLFAGRGILRAIHTQDNLDGVQKIVLQMRNMQEGLIFANLSDFDVKFGHRNNPSGFASALEQFDKHVPELEYSLKETDMLIITADHGNDPTTESTDHSRERVPLLIVGASIRPGTALGILPTLADLGATIGEVLLSRSIGDGTSFLRAIRYQ